MKIGKKYLYQGKIITVVKKCYNIFPCWIFDDGNHFSESIINQLLAYGIIKEIK